MRRATTVATVLMLWGAMLAAAPQARAVETGCRPSEAGYVCIFGPIEIEYGANQPGGALPLDLVPSIPEPGYIVSARAALIGENGRPIPHHLAHLHHAVWFNGSRHDMTCPNFPDRFFATGKERTKVTLPDGYGYYWDNQPSQDFPSGTNWLLNYHIDGMHQGRTTTGYLRLNLGFHAMPEGSMTDVTPVWLDVDNCSDSEFDVPRHSGTNDRYRRSWDYTMPAGGEFVAMFGHLHDGGIKLVLRNLTAGEGIFTSRAHYDSDAEPDYLTSMDGFSESPGRPIAQGDMVRLTAVYDSSRARPGAMGIMVGLLAPGS